jgi:hypothetical protein
MIGTELTELPFDGGRGNFDIEFEALPTLSASVLRPHNGFSFAMW